MECHLIRGKIVKTQLSQIYRLLGIAGLYLLMVVGANAAQPAKIDICHAPPSNTANTQLIQVGSKGGATDDHLSHGDWLATAAMCDSIVDNDCDGLPDDTALDDADCEAQLGAGAVCDAGTCIIPSSCGDEVLDPDEEFDPPPGPFASAPVDATSCRYDFSNAPQLYCNGTCTYDAPTGCGQGDADLFCQLKTDNPASTATSFTLTTALAQPGFSCPLGLGTSLGTPFRGVAPPFGRAVHYQDSSILANHGAGAVVTNVVCTNP
jgi:hypothetical protein